MYLITDTETGGQDPQTTSLLQIHIACADRNLKVVDNFSVDLIPDDGIYKVVPAALSINKIDLLSHSKAAMKMKDAGAKLESWLTVKWANNAMKPLMVLGWNVNFDVRYIVAQLVEEELWKKYCGYRVFDLAGLVEGLKLRGKLPEACTSLGKTAEFFGISTTGAHDAKVDVEITLKVLRNCMALL